MRLGPFFGYFGAKTRAAKLYPAPAYDTVVEPFAGSAGYSLLHHRKRVVLIDQDENIVSVWQFLLRASPSEILALPDLEDGASVDDLPGVCWEAKLLIGFWLQGSCATRKTVWSTQARKKFDANPTMRQTSLSYWTAAQRARIASQLQYIRHWTVLHGSWELTQRYAPATFFVDPPYQQMGKHYRKKFTAYAELAQFCQSAPGQVIACEAEPADWLPFQRLYLLPPGNASRASGREPRHELVWHRSDSETGAARPGVLVSSHGLQGEDHGEPPAVAERVNGAVPVLQPR